MLFSELPPSQPIVTDRAFIELLEGFTQAMAPNRRLGKYDIATGGPSSCRVFLPAESRHGIPLHEGGDTAHEITRELLRFGQSEARYPERPAGTADKGWEIRRVEIDGLPAVVATAAWIVLARA